jgi:hypothetical protein
MALRGGSQSSASISIFDAFGVLKKKIIGILFV